MEAVIISHGADLDGLASAAMLVRKYKISTKNVILVDYGRKSMEDGEKLFNSKFKEGGTLFITDLNAESTPDIFSRIIDKVDSKGGKVFWFDHHPWSDQNIENIAKRCKVAVVGENKQFCAAEITAREIRLNDSFVRELLHITHISDFALDPENTQTKNIIGNYVLSMTYYRMGDPELRLGTLEKMVECISNGIIMPSFVKEAAGKFTKINDERLDSMEKTLVNGGLVSLGFSKLVSTNNACMRIKEMTGSDIGCYINLDTGTAHFRSTESDTSKLARAFGGGGHPHASAFEFDSKKYNMKTQAGRGKLAQDVILKSLELYK